MAAVLPFERQPLEAPLNEKARRALHDLANKRSTEYGLHAVLTQATKYLDGAVGPLNDRAQNEKARHDKKLAKLAESGEEETDGERERYEAFQTKVDELTASMDTSIRHLIDTRTWLEELPASLKHVSNTSSSVQATPRSTHASSLLPTQDHTPTPFHPDAAEQDEDEGMQDADQPPAFDQTPSALLHAALTTQKMRWDAKTLTERYAHDNDYTGFYANRFAAQHPEDNALPMPTPAIWFAAEEGRHASASQLAPGDDESVDSDVEVAAERISIKCPITLLPFDDPVTSQKCKHSFERTAIMNMIRTSDSDKILTPDQEAEIAAIRNTRDRNVRRQQLLRAQPKGVKCPECRTFFQETDLKPNPILQRRVQRELDAQRRREEAQRDNEDDSDQDDAPSGTQRRPVGLESSPFTASQRRRSALPVKHETGRLKRERASGRVPDSQELPTGTQRTSQGAMVVDLDDDDESLDDLD